MRILFFPKELATQEHMFIKNIRNFDEIGHEWVRHESPRAHIRRGRSYKLSDASGRLPDAPWGRFLIILSRFGVEKGRPNLPENLLYIPFKGTRPCT